MVSFSIRPATLEASDHELLVNFWDSQIEWLGTIGSEEQWGRESIRETRPDAVERPLAWLKKSQEDPAWSADWVRAWIAEADAVVGDQLDPHKVPTAGLVLSAKSADYVRSVLPEQDEKEPFVYLAYLMSNRAAGELRKGAGTALIAFAKERVRELGIHRLCLDCWAGNDRKLVKYYESQGFKPIGDFVVKEKNGVEVNWPGCVLEMRL